MDDSVVTRSVKADPEFVSDTREILDCRVRLSYAETRRMFFYGKNFVITGPIWAVEEAIGEIRRMHDEHREEMRVW